MTFSVNSRPNEYKKKVYCKMCIFKRIIVQKNIMVGLKVFGLLLVHWDSNQTN